MINDIRLGPAILTSKDGKSRLEATIQDYNDERLFVDVLGVVGGCWVNRSFWTITYPDPPLPTLPHAVVQAGDKSRAWSRILVTEGDSAPWGRVERGLIGGIAWETDAYLLSYCRDHGGVEVVFNGIEPKGGE